MTSETIASRANGRSSVRETVKCRLLLAFVLLLSVASGASAQPQVEYYQTDAVGSVRVVTNQTGAVVRRHDYLAFGEELSLQPCLPTGNDARRFTGKVRDWESCLDYFEARYYRGSSGRFSTVDPLLDVEAALVDPQQWNRYAYARNNPLYYADPDGRFLQAAWAWLNSILSTPTGQRVGEALATQRANLVMLARQLLGAPATPQLLQAAGELATGTDIPGGLPATGAAHLLPSEIAESFVGPVHRFVTKSDLTVFRFWTPGAKSREIGQWLTTKLTVSRILASGDDAIDVLHLNPSRNRATMLSEITIPKDTEVFVGRIRNGESWATQIWIRDQGRLRVVGQIDGYGVK